MYTYGEQMHVLSTGQSLEVDCNGYKLRNEAVYFNHWKGIAAASNLLTCTFRILGLPIICYFTSKEVRKSEEGEAYALHLCN